MTPEDPPRPQWLDETPWWFWWIAVGLSILFVAHPSAFFLIVLTVAILFAVNETAEAFTKWRRARKARKL